MNKKSFRIKKLKEKKVDKSINTEMQPLQYEIESIIGDKIKSGKLMYQVKWTGYDKPTWEPSENLYHCQDLINEFQNNQKLQKQKMNQNCEIRDFSDDFSDSLDSNQTYIKSNQTPPHILGDLQADIPQSIIRIIIIDQNQDLNDSNNWTCLVRWKKRKDGSYPLPSRQDYKLIKLKHPGLIIDLYELQAKVIK